jgi:sugar/nucleoside kinase (ribokinase family)
MPKPLIKPKEETAPGFASPAPAPTAPAEPQMEYATRPHAASAPVSVDVSLIFALYKKCVENGYPNCDVLKRMATDVVKERLKSVIETELANLVAPEFRGEIGQICIEV